ncbi:CHAT domain-containing protein [Chlorogloeopsis sp. ULAP01]|uniref:CHAT domain-containing protein n=1 Tax=Chlorogloeopsis sp. ULAP01 TaxID=3056483 RepID=UPI0025AAAE34|nr:CHAT domain-containing protein [Chlorogloeopsis sp. ULAP01]MDM9381135.1 CHAT domain-containing protein [Chlorogloeopsis sp. ULAP01]
MRLTQTVFIRKLKNSVKRIYKKRSLFLASLLFLFSAVTPPVVATIPPAISIVQTQQDARQLANKAIQLYRSGKIQEAADLWEKAVPAFATQKDSLNQAMALSNLSLTYQQLGQWEQAKKASEDSLSVLKIQPQSQEKLKILAQALDIQGNLYREMGRAADALSNWQEATKIYGQINESNKLDQSKINQAQAMQDLGLYPRACNNLLEVLNQEVGVKNCQEFSQLSSQELRTKFEQSTSNSPSLNVILGLRSLGELLRVIGQPEQSEIVLERSLNLVQKLNSPEEQAATYLSIGNTAKALAESERVRRRRENYDQKALDAYSQVLKLSKSAITRQQAQLNQLSLLLKLKRFSEAEALWTSLNSQLSNLPPSRTGIYQQINLAQSLVRLAQTEKFQLKANSQLPSFNDIDQILTRSAAQAKSLGDNQAEAYALGNRGALYERSGNKEDLSQAATFTNQALSKVSSLEAPQISYQYFWQLGRIRKAQQEIPDAIAAYTKAYNALQSLRSDLVAVNPEVQFSFRDTVEPIYRQLVELELEYADSLKKAGKNEESQKRITQARDVIESLQLAEINNFFREACVEANPRNIDEVDASAAVIYPIILPDRLEVILSLPNKSPQLYTTKITKPELDKTVEQMQRFLRVPQSDIEESLPYYQTVYNWLIRPLEKDLASSKAKTLVFVLDGELRNIPMAVLHDGKNYLLEKYAIALTPGLQLFNPKPLADIKIQALTAGLSQVRNDLPAHEGFEPLPNVPLELERIKKLGISTKSLLDNQFTSKEIQTEIDDSAFPIVHLATHAQFSSNAEDTFILFWDRRINVKQLGSLLQDNTLKPRRQIELLVLSACETAIGDQRAALGLAGVAVRSGARSTLATLWSVQDESTAKFMGELYSQLEQAKKTKLNKAQALQQAQLTLLKDKQYSNPHFWAPFVVVGNWQ